MSVSLPKTVCDMRYGLEVLTSLQLVSKTRHARFYRVIKDAGYYR
jgi:hypothetical protein